MASLQTKGVTLKIGDGGGPEVFTAIEDVVDINGPDGTAAEIPTTHLASTRTEFLMGLPDEGSISATCNYSPDNTQQTALKTARDAQTLTNFELLLPDTGATVFSFAAYVMQWSQAFATNSKGVLNVTLRITGEVTIT